eukprot:scaffold33388_cov122-Isochrysis_galbana.AAC.10
MSMPTAGGCAGRLRVVGLWGARSTKRASARCARAHAPTREEPCREVTLLHHHRSSDPLPGAPRYT